MPLDGDQLDPAPPRFSEITLRLTPAGIAASSSRTSSPPRRSPPGTTKTRGPDYVRSKGKLLSRAGHWALAQIRTEHLEAFERGEMTMAILPEPESEAEEGIGGWSVTPRLPAWWPLNRSAGSQSGSGNGKHSPIEAHAADTVRI